MLALPPYDQRKADLWAIRDTKIDDKDELIYWLLNRVTYLERELAGAEDRYKQLDGIYTKLADQWNAFQATARPDNRNVHRAEAAGEMARKLAEAFLSLAYDKDARQVLLDVLSALALAQVDSRHANLAKDALELPEYGPDRR
jgi:hypothetical protein